MRVQRALLREPPLAQLALVRFLAGVSSLVHNQVLLHAERLAAHLAYVRLHARVYAHVDLQVVLAAHGLAAHLARDQILARVYLQVHLERGLPVALKVADGALVFLPLAVGLHVQIEISRARVPGLADLAHERLLAGVREQVAL